MTWLAFDIGTSGTKAAILSGEGRTLQSAYRAYPMRSAEGGIAEQNAVDWWHAVVEAARKLDTSGVDAIALTGQMQDVILIDQEGTPTRRAILYSDTRAQAEAEEINGLIGVERLRELTRNSQDASSLLAKLVWLTRREPKALEKSAHLLFGAADYIAFKMTSKAITDTTTASTTGLLDIDRRALLDASTLSKLGLSEVIRLFPQVNAGGAQAGTLDAQVAEMLGVKAGIPVFHGPGDAGATTLGAGSGEPGTVYGYIGTSGWVAFSSAKRITQEAGIITLAHPHVDRFIYIAPLLTAGGNLDWVRALFAVDDLAALVSEALECEPTNLLYLPYLNGERSPFVDPLARGAFIGLNPRHSRADLSRAVLEGVVYAYRHALDTLIGEPIGVSRAWR